MAQLCIVWKASRVRWRIFKKGQLIYIEGRLQTRSWEDDSGTKKYKTEVVGAEVTMLGKKTDVGGGSREVNDGSDDDLPF